MRPDPDILNCEVKWALGRERHYMSNTNGGDRIQDVLFKILKINDAVKGLQALCQTLWKTQQWPKNWKRSVSISVP